MTKPILERRRAALDAVRRYVDGPARRLWNVNAGTNSVDVTIPESGMNSLVYFVALDGETRAVVHAFKKTAKRRRLADGLCLAERHDLPVPKILDAGLSAIQHVRFGYCFLMTQFMQGRQLEYGPLTREQIAPMAEALSRLHGVTSKRWGKPGELSASPIRESWRGTVEKRLHLFRVAAPDLDPARVEHLATWFKCVLDELPEPGEFQLCHHHLGPDDMVFDEATGRIYFVDCDALQFSRASRGLATIRRIFFDGEDSNWTEFLNLYCSGLPSTDRSALEREIKFFMAFHLLGKMCHANRESEKSTLQREHLFRLTEHP